MKKLKDIAKEIISEAQAEFGLDVYKNIEWLGEKANWKGDNRLISVNNQKMKSLGWQPEYRSKEAIIQAVKDMP